MAVHDWSDPRAYLERLAAVRGGTFEFAVDPARPNRTLARIEWPVPGGACGGAGTGSTPAEAALQLLFSLRYRGMIDAGGGDG